MGMKSPRSVELMNTIIEFGPVLLYTLSAIGECYFFLMNCRMYEYNCIQSVHTGAVESGTGLEMEVAACALWIKELGDISRCNSTSVCCETPLLLNGRGKVHYRKCPITSTQSKCFL